MVDQYMFKVRMENGRKLGNGERVKRAFMCTNGETTQLARRQGCGFGGYSLAAMMAVAVAVALPAVAQNVPPSHYLKVYWLAKDDTVNFMVVDDDNKYRVYECEIHGRTMRTCTIPPHTYEVTDFSQAALPQEPAKARTVSYDAGGDFGEATSIRDLPLDFVYLIWPLLRV
jgi:hypothetical protein